MTTLIDKPLIYAAEAWTCDDEGDTLRPTSTISGLSSEATKMIVERSVSELSPIILKTEDLQLTNGDAKGFNALFSIPVIATKKVLGCVVLAVSCPEDAMGAFEIWSRDDRDELGLNGAVFAGLSRFASISKQVKFPRGSGLPGQSWENSEAMMLKGLGSSPNFMRAAGARAGGLDVGVALPIFTTEHDLNSVVLLLSSSNTPMARVFEIWEFGGDEATLRRAECAGEEATLAEATEMTYSRGEGIVGKVWETGKPFVTDDLTSIERKRIASIAADGLSSAIAIPIYVGSRLSSAFVMMT